MNLGVVNIYHRSYSHDCRSSVSDNNIGQYNCCSCVSVWSACVVCLCIRCRRCMVSPYIWGAAHLTEDDTARDDTIAYLHFVRCHYTLWWTHHTPYRHYSLRLSTSNCHFSLNCCRSQSRWLATAKQSQQVCMYACLHRSDEWMMWFQARTTNQWDEIVFNEEICVQ